MKTFRTAALIASLALLLLVPSALAQSSTERGYGAPGSSVQRQIEASAKPRSLPFSGLDILMVVGVAGLLMVTGLTLKHMARLRH